MHEMSLAMEIIELVSRRAQEEGALTVDAIELEVGSLAGVMIEALEFCFAAAARDTLAENAILSVHEVHGQGSCPQCGTDFLVDAFPVQCPQCGEWAVGISGGRDLSIKAIHIKD